MILNTTARKNTIEFTLIISVHNPTMNVIDASRLSICIINSKSGLIEQGFSLRSAVRLPDGRLITEKTTIGDLLPDEWRGKTFFFRIRSDILDNGNYDTCILRIMSSSKIVDIPFEYRVENSE